MGFLLRFRALLFVLATFGPVSGSTFGETNEGKVLHIIPHTLDQSEDKAYAAFIENAFEHAGKMQASLVILEINTPGGELGATLAIKDTILKSGFKSICFVNTHAISAGSLIALSCDKTVMAPGGVIGAATPVMPDAEKGMKKAPEKIVSAGRAAWRSAAKRNGKSADIAEAFVDDSLVLTEKEHGIDKPAGTLLTLDTEEALKLNIADYKAATLNEIIKKENKTEAVLITYEPGFEHGLLSFFLNPAVSGILIGLGFLGLLYELKAPGWGIAGATGLLFLSLYFVSRIMIGVSGWGAPALFAFGLFLLLLEFLVIPGFGVAGIIGFLSIIASVLWSYGIASIEEGLWVMSIALLGLITASIFLFKYIPVMAGKNKNIFLNTVLENDLSGSDLLDYVGKKGKALTVLRPSGKIQIGREYLDAVSDGSYIEPEDRVQVILVEGSRVVVRKV